MKWHTKVRLKGFLGSPDPAPFALNALSDSEFRSASARGQIRGLRRYLIGRSNSFEDDLEADEDVAEGKWGKVCPLALEYERVFHDNVLNPSDNYNKTSNWLQNTTAEEEAHRALIRGSYRDSIEAELAEKMGDQAALNALMALIAMPFKNRAERRKEIVLATEGEMTTPIKYGQVDEDATNSILDRLDWIDQLNHVTVEIAGDDIEEGEENQTISREAKGFIEQVKHGFGDFGDTLYWPLAAPNIGFELTSVFMIRPNQPFCIDLYRYKPAEAQQDLKQAFEWGRYRMEFSEGKDVRIQVFRTKYYDPEAEKFVEVTPVEKKRLLDKIATLEAKGKANAAQRKRLVEIERKMNSNKRDFKLGTLLLPSGEAVAEDDELDNIQRPLVEEKARIEATYKDGLSPADEEELAKTNEFLFAADETLELGESAPTLYNVPIRLTLIPSTTGYLYIHLEGAKKPFIFEDKSMREYRMKERPKSLKNMWDQTRIRWTGNGGAWLLRMGRTRFKKEGKFLIGPFFDGADGNPGFGFDIGSRETIDWQVILSKETTSVRASRGARNNVETSITHKIIDAKVKKQPVKYVEITLKSNAVALAGSGLSGRAITPAGLYTPFLYWAYVRIPGGPVPETREEIVWDSEDYLEDGVPEVLDFAPSFEEEWGGMSADLALSNPYGRLALPKKLKKRLVDVSLVGCDDKTGLPITEEYPQFVNGIITGVTYRGIDGVLPNGEMEWREHSEVALHIADLLSGVAEELDMKASILGDGREPGKVLKETIEDAGLGDTSEIELENALGRKLPSSDPTEPPTIWPEKGEKVGAWLKRIGGDWGFLNKFGHNAGKWYFRPSVPDEPTVISFIAQADDLPPNEGNSDLIVGGINFGGASPGDPLAYRRIVLDEQELPFDDDGFFNIMSIKGAADPLTGKPLRLRYENSASWLDEEAIDFIGYEKALDEISDDSARTIDDAMWLLLSAFLRHSNPGEFVQIGTLYQPDLRHGQFVLYNGQECRIHRLGACSIANDSMSLVLRRHADIFTG